MNKLGYLRKRLGITLRELTKYVDIDYSTLCALENARQPFREKHVIRLCHFFDVSSDYLLGLSKQGVHIYFKDETEAVYISEEKLEELGRLFGTEESIISSPNFTICFSPFQQQDNGMKGQFVGHYSVYREVKATAKQADLKDEVRAELDKKLDTLTESQLKKILKFVEDYLEL